MLEFLNNVFSSQYYMPHGHCYLWQTPLVALHLVSDALIAIAYFSIPAMLIYFIRKRRDIPFSKVFVLFGAFIVLCGTGHLLDIWTLWHPNYWISGLEQALTALVSCYTALKLVELLPMFLALKSPEQLEAVNRELEKQVIERQRMEETLRMIVSGTASVTGEDFFPALVQNLATALDVPYALISEQLPQRPALRTLACWIDDHLIPNFEYNLKDTPCNQVVENLQPYCCPRDLQKIFPNSQILKDLKAESYLGVPLLNDNHEIIGNLCILDTKPFESDHRAHAIMSVFAGRVATELQRKWAEEEKLRAYEDLEFRVEERTSELVASNTALETEIQERIATEAAMKLMAEREQTINRIILRMRQTLDLETIFQATTAELRQAIHCDRVLIYRFNPDWSGALVSESVAPGWKSLVSKTLGNSQAIKMTVDHPNCAIQKFNNFEQEICDTYLQNHAGGIYRQKNSYCCVPDIHQAGFSRCYLNLLEQIQARAYIIAPIFCRNQLWGLLAVYQNSSPRSWQDAEIQIATQISNQLGVAVQQAELFAQTQHQAEELQKAKETADAASRAKSEFLASMSHELRTPLNAILGFTQLMQRERSLSSSHQRYVEIINHSGEHLLRLINDVLEMSKIEAGRVTLNEKKFDLHQLLATLEAMLQLKAQSKGIQFGFKWDATLPQLIKADDHKLRQVLINLLGNAIKFTEKGYVMLRVSQANTEEKETTSENSSSLRLRFEVEDTGPGIAPEELKDLFQAFKQTRVGRESREGTGLGLRISQQFVQMMGGEITVKSTLGQGSCFSFQIQATTMAGQVSTASSQPKTILGLAPGQPNYRILIAEDIPVNRLLLATFLKEVGFEVQEAENGQEAIALWQAWHPHAIFMDMEMPVLNGYEATRKIRAEQNSLKQHQPSGDFPANSQPLTKIIAITASAFTEQRDECLTVGCDDFVSKPFRREEILEALGKYLGIQYSCENIPTDLTPEQSSPQVEFHLNAEALTIMSPEWIAQLYLASAQGNDEMGLKLIAQIPSQYPSLITALTNLMETYEFDRIMALTQPKVLNKV